MFRILNRIKREHLKKGKLRSFLLYTFGELFLIVVGILIALQIEESVQNSSDQANARRLLQDIKRDLQADTLDLGTLIRDNKEKKKFADSLFVVLNEKPVNVNLFLLCFSKTLVHNFFYANSTNFDRSNTDGSVRLLTEKIRKELFAYYRESNSNHPDKVSQSVYETIYTPYTIEHILPTQEFTRFLGIEGDFSALDIESIRENRKFNSAMIIRIADIGFQNSNWDRQKQRASEILSKIETELD